VDERAVDRRTNRPPACRSCDDAIHVRAGAIVPFDPVRQRMAGPVSAPTTLRVYPPADGDFALCHDTWPAGDAALTRFRWNDRTHTLTIDRDARYRSSRRRSRGISA
jgi:alpha-glucosidase/alpha-D-xyloside xylohydrolase